MPVGRRLMTIWIALSLALAGGLGFGAWTLFGPEDAYEYHGGFFGTASAAPALDLTDQHGRPFSLDALRGKVVFLYFGYTACPDYCPTTLADLQTVKTALGDRAGDVAVVMVTVDPERDTPERLNEYLASSIPPTSA